MVDVLGDILRPGGDAEAVLSSRIRPDEEPKRNRDGDPLVVVAPAVGVRKEVGIDLVVPSRQDPSCRQKRVVDFGDWPCVDYPTETDPFKMEFYLINEVYIKSGEIHHYKRNSLIFQIFTSADL